MDLQQIRGLLRIVKHRLDDELEIQAELQDRIGQEVASLNAVAAAAKTALEAAEADAVIKLRNGHHEKLSADELKARVCLAPAVVTATQVFQMKQKTLAEWQSVYDAWRARGYALRNLTALHGQQYFAVDSGTRQPSMKARGEAIAQTVNDRRAIQDAGSQRGIFEAPAQDDDAPSTPRRRLVRNA